MRHTGAGGFTLSSTVQINVLVARQLIHLLIQIIRLNANRSVNSMRSRVVITMAADIGDNHALALVGIVERNQISNFNPRNNPVNPLLFVGPDAVRNVGHSRSQQKEFERMRSQRQSPRNRLHEVAEEKPSPAVSENIKESAAQVIAQKFPGRHLHAAS